jgi:Kef-type K+ transport system membrane component KefB
MILLVARATETPRLELGQALVFLYGFFAFAAGGRSVYQLATRFDEAPLAVSLSVVAAAVYALAFTQLRRRDPRAWRLAIAACSFELVGVVVVGSVSLAYPDLFPRATVWSTFGLGYGFFPLFLPIAGLTWLLRPETRRAFRANSPG